MGESLEAGRRNCMRFNFDGTIRIRRGLSEPILNGKLVDLSTGGCLAQMDSAVRFLPADIIEVKLQASDLSFRVLGEVRHISRSSTLLGIEFHRLGARESAALAEFIADRETTASFENSLPHP